ncbi:MAG: DUF5807 family protein [Halolamina sp.]
MSKLSEFLAGERLDDVALYLAEDQLDEDGRLAEVGEERENGVVLVVPGEKGRQMFSAGTGMDAMQFAKEAMGEEGTIRTDLSGGDCPAGEDGDHDVQFIFAFAEAENPEVGGMYADGDVVHAYAQCTCGEAYSEKWVVGSRSE